MGCCSCCHNFGNSNCMRTCDLVEEAILELDNRSYSDEFDPDRSNIAEVDRALPEEDAFRRNASFIRRSRRDSEFHHDHGHHRAIDVTDVDENQTEPTYSQEDEKSDEPGTNIQSSS